MVASSAVICRVTGRYFSLTRQGCGKLGLPSTNEPLVKPRSRLESRATVLAISPPHTANTTATANWVTTNPRWASEPLAAG